MEKWRDISLISDYLDIIHNKTRFKFSLIKGVVEKVYKAVVETEGWGKIEVMLFPQNEVFKIRQFCVKKEIAFSGIMMDVEKFGIGKYPKEKEYYLLFMSRYVYDAKERLSVVRILDVLVLIGQHPNVRETLAELDRELIEL